MGDTYGDSWNGNTLVIDGTVSFSGPPSGCESDCDDIYDSCYSGSPTFCFEVAELCVAEGVHTITVGGGSYQSEVEWRLKNLDNQTLAEGGAPYDGSFDCCSVPVFGCTDEGALNFDADADTDDGSCLYPGDSCETATAASEGTNAADGNDEWFTYSAPAENGLYPRP